MPVEDWQYALNDLQARIAGLERRIPVGGTDNQVLTKVGTANYAIAWEAPPGKLVAYKMGTAAGVFINFNQASNATPLHIFNVPMVAGRIYLLQFTFRAIQSNNGMYAKLQKDNADVGYDYYIGAGSGVGTWTSANICWLLAGSSHSGTHQWNIDCWHLNTSGTSQVYNEGGGFAAAYDVGEDPGAQ